MQISDEQFNRIMSKIQFRKNQAFKSNPINQEKMISYIKNMEINDTAFQIIQNLIKEFTISILMCFQPFYAKIIQSTKAQTEFKQKLQRISSLVIYVIRPAKCGELNFFLIAGTAKKGFKIREKTQEQIQVMKQLEFIRSCIVLKKQNSDIQQISKQSKQKLDQIQQKIINKKYSPFSCYYLKCMLAKVGNEYLKQKIQGSTMEQTNEQGLIKKKQVTSQKKSLTIEKQPENSQALTGIQKQPINQAIKQNQLNLQNKMQKAKMQDNSSMKIPQKQQIIQVIQMKTSEGQNKQKVKILSQEDDKKTKSQPLTVDSLTNSLDLIRPKTLQNMPQCLESQNQICQISALLPSKIADKLDTRIKDQQQLIEESLSTSIYGMNFALIPLCCRTFFFNQERILSSQERRLEFKSYRFPFNPASIQTFKKTICAFRNTSGGQIYIGIKETTQRKYRYILGNYLTENDKEEVLKSFRKIGQSIYPNVQDLQVQFIPVRNSPFQLNILKHVQTYYYDFTKKKLDLAKCPYMAARYVIRVKVPIGKRQQMYSYIQTDYQLNKNSNSSQFIPFRSQNQVLVKQISQEVLRKFRQKLIYGQQIDPCIHKGDCLKPDIGNPKNEPQPLQQVLDAKQIQAPLYADMINRRRGTATLPQERSLQTISQQSRDQSVSYQQSINQQENETIESFNNSSIVTQKQLQIIFKYPLHFAVLRISRQRLRKVLQKTPAKQYTKITLQKNQISGQDLLLMKVDSYGHMQQFIRIKTKIENHFKKYNAQIIGVSKIIKLQNPQNRRVAQQLLNKYQHKYVINNRNLEFYSITVAASYFLYMRDLGYKLQATPD